MAGVEGERPHVERTPQQSKPTEQQKPHQEGGNGIPGLPPTLHGRAKPPPAYEGRQSTSVQREQQPYSGGVNKPEVPPPKESPLPFEPNLPSQEHRRRNLSAADLEILTMLKESRELLGKLPYPLAPEFIDSMTEEVVHEVWTEHYPELKRQADQRDEQLEEEIMEVLEDPLQRKKLLEDD